MLLVWDNDLNVACAIRAREREFIEHHGIFHLLECISVNSVDGYFATRQKISFDWKALKCVGLFLYSWDTGVVHSPEEYCATLRDHGEPVGHGLPAVAFDGLGSSIRIKDERQELWVYRGKEDREKLPGAPIEVVAEDLNSVYNCALIDGDWAVTDLESTPEGAVCPGLAGEICKSFCCIRQVLREAGVEVQQHLLELVLSLAEESIAAPFSTTTLGL